jgi:pimeloyl-ACP methyl ester carboxylesterase
VNIRDWVSAYGFPITAAALAAVGVPTLVLRGGASHPAVQRANDLLSEWMPSARLVTVAGAAHFMIATHVAAVANAIAQHVAGAEAVPREQSAAGLEASPTTCH